MRSEYPKLLSKIKTSNTILYCDLFSETVRFYREVLGFPIVLSKSWFVEFAINKYARISVADSSKTTIKSSKGDGITVTFQISDSASIQTIRTHLLNNGYAPTPVVTHPWGAVLFRVKDPEGNRLEFWSDDPQSKNTA